MYNRTLFIYYVYIVQPFINVTRIYVGETEKLAQGIFHNYPEICDRKLDNVSVSLEWFQFYDLVTSLVMHKQIWSLMPYTNHGFIAWHLQLARAQKAKLSYPTVVNEVRRNVSKYTPGTFEYIVLLFAGDTKVGEERRYLNSDTKSVWTRWVHLGYGHCRILTGSFSAKTAHGPLTLVFVERKGRSRQDSRPDAPVRVFFRAREEPARRIHLQSRSVRNVV